MEKHFKLTSNSKVNKFGVTLFQIELTIDCKWGKKGDLGGWVEKEKNIYGDARVSDNARVYGDAWFMAMQNLINHHFKYKELNIL